MQTSHFQDFDAFADSVRDVDSRMMLRNPKRRIWSTSSVDLDGIDVQVARLGSGNIAQGELRPDGYLLYLPLTDGVKYSANGSVLDKGSFAILEPGCEFCISTRVEHDWCGVFVPTQMLAHGGELVEPSSGSEKVTCRATRPNQQAANQFGAVVGQIMSAAANYSQFESTRAASRAATELVKVVSLVVEQRQAGEPKPQGRPRLPRQEIIRRCTELIEEGDDEIVLVGELSAAADVSERTLQTTFNAYYGVGPVRYLQLRQLHRIRHALRAADPEAVSVTEVIVRYGEWQLGRFASRYRRLFGELPSETLRKKTV